MIRGGTGGMQVVIQQPGNGGLTLEDAIMALGRGHIHG